MGMIRRADLDQITRQGTVMDLSDLRARGDAIISDATREAERIIAAARAERERLLAGADAEGHRQGFERGLGEGREEGRKQGYEEARKSQASNIEAICAGWRSALERFESDREALLSAARAEVVELSVEIAARVIRRVVEIDPSVVLSQVEAVLGAIMRPTRLKLRVHPADLELARMELPSIVSHFELCRHADLVPDPSLERGSCIATTEEGGRIDAAIGSQLDRIVAELLPDRSDAGSLRVDSDTRSDAA
ncbi:MAG: hypothetical protein D6692_03615 [Planctomycetota bacterium]|nr:MAG: hypothetical protein D6692_03615 [Planctomycetota bacterium]